ncbi:MAG TPA: hypothetical protein VHC44_15050 [Verrucomicrobiae bacterium]|nr:hypothetical protein [Verrucomicrobiae bacterium]
MSPDSNQPFIKFCNDWAGVAQFVGLGISFIGFFGSMFLANRAKKAAEQARDKVLKIGSVVNISFVLAAMDEMIRLHLKGEWEVSLNRAAELRRLLIEIKDGHSDLSDQQKAILQGVIEQFRTIESVLEKFLVKGKPEPKVHAINGVIRKQIENVQGIAITLKND